MAFVFRNSLFHALGLRFIYADILIYFSTTPIEKGEEFCHLQLRDETITKE